MPALHSSSIIRSLPVWLKRCTLALLVPVAAYAAPANDSFANAATLTLISDSASTNGTNVGATKETGEPSHAGIAGGASVWWKVTAPANGALSVSTSSSSFDTVLGIYTGAGVSTLTTIGSNDDVAPGLTTSMVAVPVTAGQVCYVAVDGKGGAAGSISLSVNFIQPTAPAFISTSPAFQSADVGQSLYLNVAVSGSPAPMLQWQRLAAGATDWVNLTEGAGIAGSRSSNLTLNPVTLGMNGDQLRCVATNLLGVVASEPTTLSVNPPVAPSILFMPPTLVASAGDYLSIAPTVTGTAPLTYVWKKNGVVIPDQVSNSLGRSGVTTADSGSYTVTVSNPAGSVSSSATVVTIAAASAPVILVAPYTRSFSYGAWFYLDASAGGASPRTYQWKKDGVVIVGATSSTFTQSSATPADSGVYSVTVTNALGSITGTIATITVDPAIAPAITTLPAAITVEYGSGLSLYPSVAGSPSMTYQWSKDGTPIAGATSSSYARNTMTSADAGVYALTATNSAGSATGSVIVTVNPPVAPRVYGLPASLTQLEGGSFSFYPTFYGSQPMTYQWQKDGMDIPGATGAVYGRSNLTPADAGSYTLTATNTAGWSTSAPAVLTIGNPVAPTITNFSPYVVMGSGSYFSIYASVSGTQPIAFQWKKNGSNIPGATSPSLYINILAVTDSGSYTLTATNVAGTATSNAITLLVTEPVAPTITSNVSGLTVPLGGTLNLSPSIAGSSPQTYAWRRNGVLIPGATSPSYYKSPVTAADGGSYTLTVANSAGTATSDPITVSIGAAIPPQISSMPPAIPLPYGSTLNLSPTVTGSGPLSYQWKKDGADLPNGMGAAYLRSSVSATDAGTYVLTVSNSAGTATSTAVTVTVAAPIAPAILNLPPSLILSSGESLSLYPTITGSEPLVYQWKKNGILIGNSASYSISNASSDDGGTYTLTATNVAGTVTSNNCVVTVNAPVAPTILGLPASASITYGQGLSFNPVVTGTSPITYQWKKNGSPIPGFTSASFYKTADSSDAGSYVLVAVNAAGATTSSPIAVSVSPAVAPVIINVPANVALDYGASLSLAPTFSGTQPMAYQWYKDGVEIPGAFGNNFIKSSVTLADGGIYKVTAINLAGSTTSTEIAVTVSAAVPSVISGLPGALNLTYGSYLSLYPTVTGSLPRSYQWKKDGVAIVGATSASYNVSNSTPADSGIYTLTVTNAAGAVTSSSVAVTVAPAVAPVLGGLPAKISLNYGETIYLNPAVYGTTPMTFQWKKNGTAVASGTYSAYSVYSATPADSGSYTVTASNLAGTTTSSPVTVVVQPARPPVINAQPASVTTLAGANVAFAVVASGTGPLTYQWTLNGQPLPSGTTSTLSLNGVQTADVGSYAVTITSPGGTVTSGAATLSLVAPRGVIAVAAGGNQTFFLKDDGSLWGSGGNQTGALGDGTNLTRLSPVRIATGVARVAAGTSHALFVKADGTLWATGANSSGQLGDGTFAARNWPVQIASNVVDVAAGEVSSAFLKADGTLWTMGDNSYGQLGGGPIGNRYTPIQVATQVASIVAGSYHTLFVTGAAELWGMGASNFGQLGDSNVYNRNLPGLISPGVASTGAGGSHTIFLKTDGSLWSLGAGSLGQLGNGSTNYSQSAPGKIADSVAMVSAGGSHTLFVNTDGSLYATGYNNQAQLGDGTTLNRYSPVGIATGVFSAAAGAAHSLALKNDGSLWAVGYNYLGQLGNGTNNTTSAWSAVASGTVAAPAAPAGVIATDGTVTNGIRVTWTPGTGASYWQVWRSATNNLAGATQVSRNLSAPIFYDATSPGVTYYYWVRAVNPGGTSPASVPDTGYAFVPPPQITQQPTGQTAYLGGSVTFTAAATGSPAPTYQWRRNGVNIPGATAATLTLASVTAADLGIYTMVATNSGGSVTSNGARLALKSTINAPDFNGDAQSDLLWRNRQTGEIYLWLMNGRNFASSSYLGTLPPEWSIAATGDFNGDGQPDIIWVNSISRAWQIWLMNGTAFSSAVDMGIQPGGWSIVGTGDFNHDGRTDILWHLSDSIYYNTWYMAGTALNSSFTWTVADASWSLAGTGDFNNDDQTDLIWTLPTGERRLWVMDGITRTSEYSLGSLPLDWSVANTGDYNGDHFTDLVWQNSRTGDRTIWLMNGATRVDDASLGTLGTEWDLGRPGRPWHYVPHDFDGDGTSDLVWQNTVTGERAIWQMRFGGFASTIPLGRVDPAWSLAAVEDLNGDRKPDLFWQNSATGDRAVWLMNGSTFASSVNLGMVPVSWTIGAVGDFYSDNTTTIAWQNTTTGECVFWKLDASGALSSSAPMNVTSTVWSISGAYRHNPTWPVGIVWTNNSTGERRVSFQGESLTGGNSFVLATVPLEWKFSSYGDYDGDGVNDIIWTNTSTGERVIWFMTSTRQFRSSLSLGIVSPSWQIVR